MCPSQVSIDEDATPRILTIDDALEHNATTGDPNGYTFRKGDAAGWLS